MIMQSQIRRGEENERDAVAKEKYKRERLQTGNNLDLIERMSTR